MRPLSDSPRFEMDEADLRALGAALQAHPWYVVRFGGYFWDYAQHRHPQRTACPRECACTPLPNVRRACEVAAPADGARPCLVKEAVAVAVHRRAFSAFARTHRRAVHALRRAANATSVDSHVINSTWGLPDTAWDQGSGELPWFDVWLATALPNIYVLPSVVTQQTKQQSVDTSVRFAAHCFPTALQRRSSNRTEPWGGSATPHQSRTATGTRSKLQFKATPHARHARHAGRQAHTPT